MEGPTVHDVLKTISDTTCLDMFRIIAKGSVESDALKVMHGLSKKTVLFSHQTTIENGTGSKE